MNTSPNKYLIISLLMVSFFGFATEVPPPPPAGAPTPPGFPIDGSLLFLAFVGITFLFFFLKRQTYLNKKA